MTADYERYVLICDQCRTSNDLKELTIKGGYIPVTYNDALLHFCTQHCMIEYSKGVSAKGESNEETKE